MRNRATFRPDIRLIKAHVDFESILLASKSGLCHILGMNNAAPTGRYEIRVISDADCTEVDYEALATADTPAAAKNLAAQHSTGWPFGVAILDTLTGEIDYGC